MTVSSTSNRVEYTGNGVTTTFDFAFRVLAKTHLKVTLYDSLTGVETVVATSAFNVTTLPATSGTVTYPISGSPIPATTSLIIQRVVPLSQLVDINNQTGFDANVTEEALDLATMVDQQLNEQVSRSIRLPVSDAGIAELPAALGRAERFLYFDANGDINLNASPTAEAQAAANAAVAAAGASLWYQSRTAVQGFSIPSDYKSMRTAAYATANDGGGAQYYRVDSEPTHEGKVRTLDRFISDGSTDAVNGGWWELVPNGGVINIKQLGAVGDNATDDTAAIQAALDMAEAAGYKAVYVPSGGAFRFTTLTMPNIFYLEFFGDGFASRLWQTGAGIRWPVLATGVGAYQQTIRDLHIVGQDGTGDVIATTYASGVRIQNIRIETLPNGFSGIRLEGNPTDGTNAANHRVIDCYIRAPASQPHVAHAGIVCGDTNADCIIDGTWVASQQKVTYCIHGEIGSTGTMVLNAHPYGAVNNVIFLAGSNHRWTFGNLVVDHGVSGFDIIKIVASENVIGSNLFLSFIPDGYAGITLDNCANCQFTNINGRALASAAHSVVRETNVIGDGNNVFSNVTVDAVANYTTLYNLSGDKSNVTASPMLRRPLTATASAVALTSGSPTTVVSLSLPPGDWLVSGNFFFDRAGGAVTSIERGAVSLSNNAFDSALAGGSYLLNNPGVGGSDSIRPTGTRHVHVKNGSQTVYLVANNVYVGGTVSADGFITAVPV